MKIGRDNMDLRDFLSKASNKGMEKPIADLTFEHLDILLSIWLINRNNFTGEHNETKMSQAFGGVGKHKFDESCVQDLFKWKILEWVKENETFKINAGLDGALTEIETAWQQLKSQQGKDA